MYKRHYLKVLIALLVSVVLLLIMFQYTAQQGPDRPSARIEILLKARQNPPDFWRVVEQGTTVAAEEFNVYCNVTAPKKESDIEGQIRLMEEAIARRPDAIILASCDYELLVPVCKKAVESGIVLVTMDSDVNYEGRSCFIGTDNYAMGKMLASIVDGEVAPDKKIGVMAHVEHTTTAVERRRGLVENLKDADTRLVALDYCDGSEELSRERTKAMLSAHPEIECMVGLNESSALGVTNAIVDLGKEGQISSIACDSSQKQIEFMERGVIQAFVVQNPFNMGYLSVQNTLRILRGEIVPPVIHTECTIIRKEDLYKKENQKLIFPFSNDG